MADFMHVPDSHTRPSGNWLIMFKSGELIVRRSTSYTKCRKESIKRLASRFKTEAKVEESNKSPLEGQSQRALEERIKVLKTAWVFGNGQVPQPWFSYRNRKSVLISHIHSAFAAFAAVPSVKIPVGLQETIMAKDFDFDSCQARFGLYWTVVARKEDGRLVNGRATISSAGSRKQASWSKMHLLEDARNK